MAAALDVNERVPHLLVTAIDAAVTGHRGSVIRPEVARALDVTDHASGPRPSSAPGE